MPVRVIDAFVDELDLWIQYHPTEGLFKGLRVKAQYANLWQQGNVRENQPEFGHDGQRKRVAQMPTAATAVEDSV